MSKHWDIKVNFCVEGDTEEEAAAWLKEEAAAWLKEYLKSQVDMRFAPEQVDDWFIQ